MELNAIYLLDNKMQKLYENFAPHFNIPGEQPYNISGNLTLLAPANNIMLEYLRAEHDHPENDTVLRDLIG